MSVKELRKSAIKPFLWRSNINKRAQRGAFEDAVDWEPAEEKKIMMDVSGQRQRIFLVPGGRYLIVADSRFLRLWDLGVPWRPSNYRPLPLAVTPLGIAHPSDQGEIVLKRLYGSVVSNEVVRVILVTHDTRYEQVP